MNGPSDYPFPLLIVHLQLPSYLSLSLCPLFAFSTSLPSVLPLRNPLHLLHLLHSPPLLVPCHALVPFRLGSSPLLVPHRFHILFSLSSFLLRLRLSSLLV